MQFDLVMVMPDYHEDMVRQLRDMGIKEEKILLFNEWRDSQLGNERETIGLKCYGQHFDDVIIAAIFGQIGIEKPTYMDLGANHPFRDSNTALFYCNGCRGINIEANPSLFANFKKERPEDINLNIGVATQEGILPFYKFDDSSGLKNRDRRISSGNESCFFIRICGKRK